MNPSGTTIGLDAAVNVSAASILTVGTLNAAIVQRALAPSTGAPALTSISRAISLPAATRPFKSTTAAGAG